MYLPRILVGTFLPRGLVVLLQEHRAAHFGEPLRVDIGQRPYGGVELPAAALQIRERPVVRLAPRRVRRAIAARNRVASTAKKEAVR